MSIWNRTLLWNRFAAPGRARRRAWMLAGAAALSLGLIGASASPAAAAQTHHGFDDMSRPADWEIWDTGVSYGSFRLNDPANAHSPSAYALLITSTGFSSVGRDWHLVPAGMTPKSCSATAMIRLDSSLALASIHHVSYEVIDPVTWTYIKIATARFWPTAGRYQPFNPDLVKWSGGPRTVFLRISVVSPGTSVAAAHVDDVRTTCVT